MKVTDETSKAQKEVRLYGAVLFALCSLFFGLMSYGGVRSPDSEIVFRTGESIALRGSFALESDLENLHAFGVARGQDGRLYSIFGPLESITIAPFIKLADWINETGWYQSIVPMLSLSHYTEGGLYNYILGATTNVPRSHALRMLCAIYNVLVSAFGVFVFWKILLLLTKSIPASFLVSVIYAFATHVWPYSGTFFSEPLATLLVLLSFLSLLKAEDESVSFDGIRSYRPVLWSGIWLGLAVAGHVTALLYAPFFAAYFCWWTSADRPMLRHRVERALVFSVGLFIILFLLGLYNYDRFGSFFETGRTADTIAGEFFGYGKMVLPFEGLFGLLFGAGKGIVLFMPIVVVSAFLWRNFATERRKLFWVVFAAVTFRILFVASRSDWHGGFSLGARYLFMAIPFLLLPVAFWLKRQEPSRFIRSYGLVAASGFVFAVQQYYLSLGEFFSFLQIQKSAERALGNDILLNNVIYLDWKYSPLTNAGVLKTAPFFLRNLGLSFTELMFAGAGVILLVFIILFVLLLRKARPAASLSPL